MEIQKIHFKEVYLPQRLLNLEISGMDQFFQMTSAGQLKYYFMNTKFNISRAVSKTTETEKKGDKQIANQSCSTLQNQQITEFKKLRESVHSLFQLAKNQLSSIYKVILKQIAVMGNQLTKNSKNNQQLILKISQIRRYAEIAILQFPLKLLNILIIPRILINNSQPTLIQRHVRNTYPSEKYENTSFKKKQYNSQKKIDGSVRSLDANYRKSVKKITANNIKDHDNLTILQAQWPLLQNINVQAKGLTHLCEFQNVKADKLQIFNLSNNLVVQLKYFKNAYFPNLTTLNLSKNRIKNIEGLQNTKFQKLNVLNLSNNFIKKLKPLTKCTFPHLLELNLSGNSLQTIQELNGCEFKKLQILTLDDNKLTTLDSLKQSSFYRLKVLSFSNNSIKSLQFLPKIYLRKLQALLGHNNKITSIEPLKYCEIPLVKQIILNNNQISDISSLKQTKFPYLIGLDLQYNNIFAKTLCCFIINDKGCRQAVKKYPFILI